MIFFCCVLALSGAWTLSGAAPATVVQRAGWLDRVVQFYKDGFVEDVRKVAPIQIQASLEAAPPGYVDSGAWDYVAVRRLLALLAVSEAAAPVGRALRRALQPSRRFISRNDTFKLFPSRGKDHVNEIYYDFTYDEASSESESGTNDTDSDDSVVFLRNPVEARLPSARISVKLLRQILEARAEAARQMPSTTASSIPWVPMNKSGASTTKTPGGKAANNEGAGDATADEATDEGGDKAADEGDAEGGDADADKGEEGADGTEVAEKGDPGLDIPEDNPPGIRMGAPRLSSVPWWNP